MQREPGQITTVPGLNSAAQAIIDERWSLISTTLSTWLASADGWYDGVLNPEHHQHLRPLLEAFKAAHATSLNRWWAMLRPLAQELGRQAAVARVQVHTCWKHGWFDYRKKNRKRVIRPPFDAVLSQVQAIPYDHVFPKEAVAALLRQSLCQDEASASMVIARLKQVGRATSEQGWEVVNAYAQYGLVGLLKHADYPGPDEQLLLQRYTPIINAMTEHPAEVLAALRADLMALYHALHDRPVVLALLEQHGIAAAVYDQVVKPSEQASRKGPENGLSKQAKKIIASGLWRQDMLHQPRHSQERKAYRDTVTPALRARVLVALMEYRGCDEMEATTLFETFAERGLAGLIDWRCAIPDQHPSQTFAMQRLRRSLDHHLSFLKPVFREELERLLICLQEAIDALELSVSLFPLVDEYPGTSYSNPDCIINPGSACVPHACRQDARVPR